MKLQASTLARLEPVNSLSADRLAELAKICSVESFDLGTDPLLAMTTAGQSVYLVQGELKVDFAEGGMRVLVGGCDEANWPLGSKFPMPVRTRAITPVAIVRIDNELLDIMMTWDQLAPANVTATKVKSEEATAWRTMSGIFHVHNLTGGALSQLPPAHIQTLMQRFDRIKVKRGQVIVQEGEPGDYYFMIESGRCEVTRQVGGAPLSIAELKPGEAFGEEALVAGESRNASVKMKTDGTLWRLAKPDFIELLQAPLLHGISFAEAEKRVKAGEATWIDVRYAAEFSQDGLPGALNIPLNEIRNAFNLLDMRRHYIVYCQSGRRSSAAAFLMAQHGFSAHWLNGGLVAAQKEAS